MSIVYTGGTFDLFHSGHVNFLRQCQGIARLSDHGYFPSMYSSGAPIRKVVVSLNTDEFIQKYKGKAPVYSYQERKELLEGCRYVNEVVPNSGGADSKPAILKAKPNLIAIGTDWASKDYYKQMGFTQQWLDGQNIQLVYLPYTEGVSTTDLKLRIASDGDPEYMCPNCVTPWKCNGPHIAERSSFGLQFADGDKCACGGNCCK